MANDEYLKTEAPFMHQLAGMGWETEDGDPDVEYMSGNRASFDEVLLKGDLRAALRRINRTAGQEWLDDVRINQAIYKLESVASPSLMEANRKATHLLRKGVIVDGDPELHDGKNQTIRYIDFDRPGFVFATIQKYQEQEEGDAFPVLNESEDILVLIDEAHRSHTSDLHANLMRALPNCAKIGFTGTPILMGAKKRTHEIFGDYLDTYTIEQAVEDGVIVKILYEGRMARPALQNGKTLDDLFEEAAEGLNEEQRQQLKRREATRRGVLEATALIQAKARDMVRHYVGHVLPNKMKAQVVATSRLAAVRYQKAITEALEELLDDVQNIDPALLGLSDTERRELRKTDPESALLATAHAHTSTLRRLKAAAVISSSKDDPPSWDSGAESG